MLTRIKKIKRVPYDGTVHNVEVQDDHTYFADGILVHNCRSIIVPITVMEVDRLGGIELDKVTDIPRAKGFALKEEDER